MREEIAADDSAYYHRHMKALLHPIAPRLGSLVLLAAALGCLFFLFELFADLTPSGGNDSSAEGSSPGPAVEVPSGTSLVTILAGVTCIALGAGALLLFLRWLKDRSAKSGWVIFIGSAPAVVMIGLGIFLLVSGTLHGSLPYGSVPDVNSQVNGREMEPTQVDAGRMVPLQTNVLGMGPLQLTMLVTTILLGMLVVIARPRLLIMLLVALLVTPLLFGLLASSGFLGLNPFGYAAQMLQVAGIAPGINPQQGPTADVSSEVPGTGAGQPEVVSGIGDLQTGAAASASTGENPLQTTPADRDTTTGETEPVFMEVEGARTAPVGVPYRVTGTLTGADDQPLSSMPVTIEVDGQPEAILNTDAQGGFAWETVFNEATEATVDVGFPGDAEFSPSQTQLPVTVATPEIVVDPPSPVARGDTLMLEGTVSVGGQPVPNTPVTVDGEVMGRTDANGGFSLPFTVPLGTPLGSMPLGLGAPALMGNALGSMPPGLGAPNPSGSSTVLATIMSATSLLLKPLEGLSLGRSVPVEAKLLDDQGVGVPDATIDCGDGVTGVTNSDGVANLVLTPLEGADLSETLENCKFDGDDSNLPAEAEVSSDGDGFNWRLWVGLPLAVVVGSVVAYLLARRRRSIATLFRRAIVLVASLLGGLAARRRRIARPGEDDDHTPVTAPERLRARGPMDTHLKITLVKLAEDLPYIWGIGEQVQVEIMLTDDSGEGVAGQTVTAVIDESGNPVEMTTDKDGRCHTSWTGTVPGTYRVVLDFAGGDRFLSASAHHEFEVVDFREDIVGRYNSFLPWVRERDPRISEQTTPREVEVMVVDTGMPVDHRAMEVVIARFEEADYSLHEIDRPRFEAMYRARRRIVGD